MDDGTYKEDTFLKLGMGSLALPAGQRLICVASIDNMHILKRGENASEESA